MNSELQYKRPGPEHIDILTQLWEGKTLLMEFPSAQDFRNFRCSLYKKLSRQDLSFKLLGIPTEDNVLYFLRLKEPELEPRSESVQSVIYTVKLIPRQEYLSIQAEKTAKKYKIREII